MTIASASGTDVDAMKCLDDAIDDFVMANHGDHRHDSAAGGSIAAVSYINRCPLFRFAEGLNLWKRSSNVSL